MSFNLPSVEIMSWQHWTQEPCMCNIKDLLSVLDSWYLVGHVWPTWLKI